MHNPVLHLSSDLSTLEISCDADTRLFNEIAKHLEMTFDGKWTAKVTGPDQRYWDLKVGSALLTLHLEHHLGISLFVAKEGEIAASRKLLRQAQVLLASTTLNLF